MTVFSERVHLCVCQPTSSLLELYSQMNDTKWNEAEMNNNVHSQQRRFNFLQQSKRKKRFLATEKFMEFSFSISFYGNSKGWKLH